MKAFLLVDICLYLQIQSSWPKLSRTQRAMTKENNSVISNGIYKQYLKEKFHILRSLRSLIFLFFSFRNFFLPFILFSLQISIFKKQNTIIKIANKNHTLFKNYFPNQVFFAKNVK